MSNRRGSENLETGEIVALCFDVFLSRFMDVGCTQKLGLLVLGWNFTSKRATI